MSSHKSAVKKWTKIMTNIGYSQWVQEVEKMLYHMIVEQSFHLDAESYKLACSIENQKKSVMAIVQKAMKIQDNMVSAQKLATIDKQLSLMIQNNKEVTRLKQGKCFGEGALLFPNNMRLATIKCVTDCYFGILSKKSYEQTVAKI